MIAACERKPLGQLLVERSLLKPQQLEQALDEQRRCNYQKLLGEVLVELRLCSEQQVAESLAQANGVPFARVSPKIADPKAMSALPREFIEKHQVLPLFLVEGILTIAVPEPTNVFLIEEIQRVSGHPVQIVAATARDIKATLQIYLPEQNVFVLDDIVEEANTGDLRFISQPTQAVANLRQMPADSPVIKLISFAILSAISQRATDIHIEPLDGSLRIRFRIDGRLHEKLRPPHLMHGELVSRLKLMAGLDVCQSQLPQEGNISATLEDRPIDLRLSTMPGGYGEKIVIRISDAERKNIHLERLGFSYENLKQWRKLLSQQGGMLLVAGPVDSGKTTTLYASLAELNRPDANICTIEDSIEYVLPGVNQFQVDAKAGLTFSRALQGALMQDPDVMLVSEIRDRDSAHLAAQAALTGRFVLAGLHTPDAASAVARLYDLGIEPYMVGASLKGVLAQRLVRKLCQNCRQLFAPSIGQRRQLEKAVGPIENLYRPRGCEQCGNTGFSGRIGVFELLTIGEALGDAVGQSQEKQGGNALDIRRLTPAKSLRVDGLEKVKAGITTLEEVFAVTP